MLKKLLNIFRIPELRTKMLFTVALLCVYRIGFYIATPRCLMPQSMRKTIEGSSGDTLRLYDAL